VLALRALRRNLMRSALTILGIAIGIAAVIALLFSATVGVIFGYVPARPSDTACSFCTLKAQGRRYRMASSMRRRAMDTAASRGRICCCI
jgi:hypothetical protein